MAETWLKTYLDHLAHELRAQGVYDPRILEEAKDHLLEAIATGQQDSLSNRGSAALVARALRIAQADC